MTIIPILGGVRGRFSNEMFDRDRRKMNMNRIHISFVLRFGAIVGMIIMIISGLAFAEDVPEGQECCACAQDEAAFDQMLTEACQNGYSEQGVENPTEEQMTGCITRTKAQILENCPEQTTRTATSDSDSDGVPDEEDNCPNVPNPLQAETDPNVKFNGEFPDMCRFIDNTDGSVTDYKNRLVWLKELSRERMKKDEAENYCSTLSIAGGGWRLPEKSEFRELVRGGAEVLSETPFIYIDRSFQSYWTSTVVYNFMSRPRAVACDTNGQCYERDYLGSNPVSYVWPVRDM
jgi:hypothetical protein